eukprot:jgi/Mesvir1/26294/Mv02486-RA.1
MRISRGCSMEEFARVCTVCVERGILGGFFEEEPPMVNGTFGVGKPDGRIRLIVDNRRGNMPLPDPMPAFLPHLGVICDLPTRAGEDVFGGVSDLDSYYNRLRLPVWMRRYCAWMPVWSDLVGLSGARRKVWPWMLCWPMGNKLAVAVAQCVHQSVLYRCGPKPPLEASRGLSINMSALILVAEANEAGETVRLRLEEDPAAPLAPSPCFESRQDLEGMHAVTIDDLHFTHCASVDGVNQQLDRVQAAYAAVGLVQKSDKVVRATAEQTGVQAVGVIHQRDGDVVPVPERVVAVIAATHRILDRGFTYYRELSSVLGKWVWMHLLCRPMLSVWSETYRLLAAMNASLPGRRWRLPAGARQELQAAIDLAPFLRAARARPLSDRVVASDASGSGGGVVYRDLPGADCARLATRREARGWRTTALTSGEDWDLERMEEGDYSLLDSGHWRTALSYRWRGQPNHINVKEAIAATQGVEWSCRTKACRVSESSGS